MVFLCCYCRRVGWWIARWSLTLSLLSDVEIEDVEEEGVSGSQVNWPPGRQWKRSRMLVRLLLSKILDGVYMCVDMFAYKV